MKYKLVNKIWFKLRQNLNPANSYSNYQKYKGDVLCDEDNFMCSL